MIIWLLVNILLPIVPIVIKYVIINMGKQEVTKINLFEIPELLYLSIYYCIITINININYNYNLSDSRKNIGETLFRLLIILIIIADCIFLGMHYSDNLGNLIWTYLSWIIFINIFLAIIYKIKNEGL